MEYLGPLKRLAGCSACWARHGQARLGFVRGARSAHGQARPGLYSHSYGSGLGLNDQGLNDLGLNDLGLTKRTFQLVNNRH